MKSSVLKNKLNPQIMEYFVRAIMFCISIVCLIIEINFNRIGISSFLTDDWGILLSLVIPVYTTFAFEEVILLKRQNNITLKNIVMISACLSLLISSFNIIAGQYNSHLDIINQKYETEKTLNINSEKYDRLKNQENEKQQFLIDIKKQIEIVNNTLSQFEKDELMSPEYSGQYWKVWDLNNQRQEYEIDLKIIQDQINIFLNENKIEVGKKDQVNFYDFIFSWSGINPGILEFLQYLIIALFPVFVGALSMYAALGLYKQAKKNIKRAPKKKIVIDKSIIEKNVEYWVNLNWMGLRNKKSRSILPAGIFYKFVENRNEKYSKRNYETMLNSAIKLGVIQQDGTIIIADEFEAVKKILNYLLTRIKK